MSGQTRPGEAIVIAGGGIAGLSLALALKQALGAAFAVIVADPAFAREARPTPVPMRSRPRRRRCSPRSASGSGSRTVRRP